MYNYYLFLFNLILSTLISISSNSWFGMWLGMEMNLMFFIAMLNFNMNKYTSEISIKYFFIQSISSMILLYMFMYMYMYKSILENLTFNLIILLKMGSAPFHFWFIEISSKLNWNNYFLLISWQKINPMIILNYSLMFYIIFTIVFMNLIVSLMSINQNNLKKIISFSSINNMSWMLSMLMLNEMLWIMNMIIYMMILTFTIYFLYFMKINFMNQFFMLLNFNLFNFNLFFNLFSMMGVPPFIGFFPKWLNIQFLNYNNNYIISTSMMILTMFMMFMYMKMMINFLMMNSLKMNFMKLMMPPSFIYFMNWININFMIMIPYVYMYY
uniref:NADH-ubiquinone oxidoreductase chain 2 n=1 Tax=Syrbatus sp. 2 RRMO-2024a TaxID=3154168 RepID=A0AAU7LKM4_9COLE